MSNSVLCQIRVLIELIIHIPSLSPEVYFFYSTAVQEQNAIVGIRGLYESSKFHNPISFLKSTCFFSYVLKVKIRMLKRVLCQIWVLLKFKFHNPSPIYFVSPRYRNKMLLSDNGPLRNFKIPQPHFLFGIPLSFRLMR